MKILVMGAGKMVEAILVGLQSKMNLAGFHIYTPSGRSAEALACKVGATFISSLDEISEPDFVFIGCKPQQLNDLSKSVSGKFPDTTFISMLAALDEKSQLSILKADKLVRVMPNLPVRFNKGVTLLSSVSAFEQLSTVSEIFSLIGLAKVVSETELEELTLLTGSGPAFFYEFAKLLAESFSSLDSSSREELARMVLAGAGLSAESESDGLDRMLGSITSKAGVTIAVIEEWRKLKMNELILNGVNAGKKRSVEIASTTDQK